MPEVCPGPNFAPFEGSYSGDGLPSLLNHQREHLMITEYVNAQTPALICNGRERHELKWTKSQRHHITYIEYDSYIFWLQVMHTYPSIHLMVVNGVCPVKPGCCM